MGRTRPYNRLATVDMIRATSRTSMIGILMTTWNTSGRTIYSTSRTMNHMMIFLMVLLSLFLGQTVHVHTAHGFSSHMGKGREAVL